MSSPDTSSDRVAIRRALVSVYDKTGLEDLVRGLDRAGVALVSTGGSAALIESVGRAGDPGGGADRLPRVPRRPGQDPAPGGARGDPRGPPPGDAPRPARRPRDRAVRPGGLQPLPVRRHRRLGRHARTSASSRSTSAGPSMVRAAAKNHPSVAIVTSPSRYADVLAAVAAGGFTLADRKGLAAEAFAHTAAYDVAVANWFAAGYVGAEDGWPAFAGDTWQKAAVLRYGENPHQSAALYSDGTGGLASADAAARQGDVLQQLRRHRGRAPGGRRPGPPRRRDHQARQPVRDRGRRRTWPRRTARRTRATRCPPSAA